MPPEQPDQRNEQDDEPVEEIARGVAAENPDPITRRESFELELMERDRAEEGEEVEVEDVAEDEED